MQSRLKMNRLHFRFSAVLFRDHSQEDCPVVEIVNFRFGIFYQNPLRTSRDNPWDH